MTKLLYIGILLITMSCTDDNGDDMPKVSLDQSFSLTLFERGIGPTDNYDTGQIIWEFQNDGDLIVQVGNEVSTPPILVEGSYRYSINDDKINVDGNEYDYRITSDGLIISDDPASDGFTASFTRNAE